VPKRLDQVRPFATLAVVAIAWLLLPVAVKTFTRATFFEFTAPINASAAYVRVLQEYWSLRLHTNSELIAAGKDLARVNASYALAAEQNANLQAENLRLETDLHLPPRASFRYETARIAQRDLPAWWERIVVLKGRNAGIPVGAPVVSADGVVGRITEVAAYTSVVELISSPNVRLAAFIEGDNRPVSFQGGLNRTFGAARGTIEFVPLDIYADAKAPKRLVTSGLGGEFPAGLTIGQVVKVAPSNDGMFQSGTVQIDSRLSELSEVTVLVPDDSGSPPPFASPSVLP
jgi:rod shape-determining protein MreC